VTLQAKALLDGVRLGLLGNSKLNADAVLLAIGDLLQERYALKSVFIRSKPNFGKPAPDDVVQEMVHNADVIVTDAMARVQGFSDYRYVLMTHPISSLDQQQVRERAEKALPQVLSILGLT
jgi:hypothetical protein